jgi:hypothetical protein
MRNTVRMEIFLAHASKWPAAPEVEEEVRQPAAKKKKRNNNK